MKVPLSWLREYVDIDIPIEELAERLTLAGLEVASIEAIGADWERDKIFVGEVIRVEPHPNADRLTLPTVDYGAAEPITVVTGAPNIRVGDSGKKVALALAGARLIDGHSETRRFATLKPTKIRGVASSGMVCSELELGISDEHEGIMILPADAPVGIPLADYLGDVILDLDLTPNLSRCFSIIGVARETAALTGKKLRLEEPHMDATGPAIEGQIVLEIEDPDACARYTAALIKNVHIGPSPMWMQRRLTLAGMRPINNIVDVTNYVMLEWGQPLHAFDYALLRPRAEGEGLPAIIVRRAKPGETIITLDKVERRLTEDMLLITDGEGPVAIAGVMGGLESEVTSSTRDILLESASFDFISNRRTSQALKLSSEASIRFGRGIPASRTEKAARRAAQLMQHIAGGEVAAGLADAYPVPQDQITIRLHPSEVDRVLGFALSADEIVDTLTRLDFTCQMEGDGNILATAPEHRLDVRIPADVLEEIARVYGYDRIPCTLLRDELPWQRRNVELENEEWVQDILVGCGMQEIISYSLTSVAAEQRVQAGADQPAAEEYLRLTNPLSSERDVMRRSLKASMLDTLSANLRHTAPVRLFEIGAVYLPAADTPLPDQPTRLALGIAGPLTVTSWLQPEGEPADFFDMKGIVETLLERLGSESCVYEPWSEMPFLPGRAARLLVDGQVIGEFGEILPAIKDRFDLPPSLPVCLAEFDLPALLSHVQRTTIVSPVPRFPPVAQDLAVLIEEGVPAERVRQVILTAGGPLLARVELFDVYRGDQVPAGQKSLAFSLQFQAPDRTLTDDEVKKIQERIIRQLHRELGANLRT